MFRLFHPPGPSSDAELPIVRAAQSFFGGSVALTASKWPPTALTLRRKFWLALSFKHLLTLNFQLNPQPVGSQVDFSFFFHLIFGSCRPQFSLSGSPLEFEISWLLAASRWSSPHNAVDTRKHRNFLIRPFHSQMDRPLEEKLSDFGWPIT
jgi:hypothetical protein